MHIPRHLCYSRLHRKVQAEVTRRYWTTVEMVDLLLLTMSGHLGLWLTYIPLELKETVNRWHRRGQVEVTRRLNSSPCPRPRGHVEDSCLLSTSDHHGSLQTLDKNLYSRRKIRQVGETMRYPPSHWEPLNQEST